MYLGVFLIFSMKIIVQDNAHPVLFLVDQFKKPSECDAAYRAHTYGMEEEQDVVVSEMKFRLWEGTANWRFIVTDGYPKALQRHKSYGRLLQKAEGEADQLKEQWGRGVVRGSSIIAVRDQLGDEFTCCSGLMECMRAMGVDVDASDLSHRDGVDYDFTRRGISF